MRKIFVLIFCVILLFSCKNNNGKYKEIDKALNTILSSSQLENANYCVIVPRADCGGCIDNATFYIKNNIEKFKKVEIIFTGVVDRKLLRLELGDTVIKRPDIHIDKSELFQNLKVKSIYPQVVKLKNGSTTQIMDLDVDNNKMSDLLKQ